MSCESCKRRRERLLEVGRTVAGSYHQQLDKLREAWRAAAAPRTAPSKEVKHGNDRA